MRKKSGFTLIEAIVSLAVLSILAVVCLGVLSSALSAKSKSDKIIKEQIALRRAVLTVTREIRMEPEEDGVSGAVSGRYEVSEGMLVRRRDNTIVAQDIETFGIEVEEGKAAIYIKSSGGQELSAVIYLRVGV